MLDLRKSPAALFVVVCPGCRSSFDIVLEDQLTLSRLQLQHVIGTTTHGTRNTFKLYISPYNCTNHQGVMTQTAKRTWSWMNTISCANRAAPCPAEKAVLQSRNLLHILMSKGEFERLPLLRYNERIVLLFMNHDTHVRQFGSPLRSGQACNI